MTSIVASEIAAFLNVPLQGADAPVLRPADLADCRPGDLVWVKECAPENMGLLEAGRPALAICDSQTAEKTTVTCVAVAAPRRAFVLALRRYFAVESPPVIHPTALIDPRAVVGRDVGVGAYTRIGPEVALGDGCRIGSGVCLEGSVELGARCRVKANSVIGGYGFGFEYDEDGTPLHFPHVGRVVFEDDVWLGACATVERATLGETRLCSGVKVDDLVQIGHNCIVGANTLIMANAVLCGGVRVGERCWIAPNSVVKQKVHLGNGVKVALGAVVLCDVANDTVVAGVPAKPLPQR